SLLPLPRAPLFPYTTLFRSSRLLRSTTCTPPRGGLAQPASSVPTTAATRTQRTDGWRIHRTTAVSFNARSLHCRVCSDALRHRLDRKSTRLNSSHVKISYAV